MTEISLRDELRSSGAISSVDSIGVVTASMADFVAATRHGERAAPHVAEAMSQASRQFHEGGPRQSAKGVAVALESLRLGAPILRIAHQPNSLVSLAIAGLGAVGHEAAEAIESLHGVRPVVAFISVDHDAVGDIAFRAPLIPGRIPPRRLTGAVPKRRRNEVMSGFPSLSSATTTAWAAEIRRAHGRSGSNAELEHALGRFAEAQVRRRSLTQANLELIDHLFGDVWRLPVACLEETALLAALTADVEQVAASLATLTTDQLVWRICPSCRKRRHASITHVAPLVAKWRCDDCGLASSGERVDFLLDDNATARNRPRFAPRVLLQDAVDILVYRPVGGVSYAGGADHVVSSRALLHHPERQLPPELVWDPFDLFRSDDPYYDAGKYPAMLYAADGIDVVAAIRNQLANISVTR